MALDAGGFPVTRTPAGVVRSARATRELPVLDDLTRASAVAAAQVFSASAILADAPRNEAALSDIGADFGRIAHLLDAVDDYDSDAHEESTPESSGTQPATDSDGDTIGDAVSETTETSQAPGEPAQDEASLDLEEHDEPVDQDEDAQWSQSFAERVEAEMAELLQDAQDAPTPSTNASEEPR